MSEDRDEQATREVRSTNVPDGHETQSADGAPPGAKKVDYWFTVLLTDPVAVPLVRVLARRRWLTPDQVTIVALALGLMAGILFAFGSRVSLLLGGICFYLAFVFDCIDGKLARATGITSDKGEALDHLADGGRRAAAALGISIYVWNAKGLPHNRVWVAIIYIVLSYFFWEISGAEKEVSGGSLGRWQSEMAKRRLTPTPGMPDVQAVVYVFGPITGLVIGGLAVGILMVTAAILLTVYRRLV
jgi:phosphatidylglycerophosphate synthase